MSADHLHSMTAESYSRVLLDIKKIAASEVGVAVRFTRPKRSGINCYLDRRGLRARRIKVERAMDILEMPADVRHHHVPRAKFCSSVTRLESPFRHCLSLST